MISNTLAPDLNTGINTSLDWCNLEIQIQLKVAIRLVRDAKSIVWNVFCQRAPLDCPSRYFPPPALTLVDIPALQSLPIKENLGTGNLVMIGRRARRITPDKAGNWFMTLSPCAGSEDLSRAGYIRIETTSFIDQEPGSSGSITELLPTH